MAPEPQDEWAELTKTMIKVGVKTEQDMRLLPDQLWILLDQLNPKSPHYDAEGIALMGEEAGMLLDDYLKENNLARPVAKLNLSPETLLDLYTELAKGMMYAAKHYGDKNRIGDVNMIGMAQPPVHIPQAFGAARSHGDEPYVDIVMMPALIHTFNYQRTTNRWERHHQDYKAPGKFFNAREAVFLTGLEEAVHAQQFKEKRLKHEYDTEQFVPEEYENAECEQEVSDLTMQAVAELGLGSDTPDKSALDNRPRRPDPKKLMDRHKKGKGGGGGKRRR